MKSKWTVITILAVAQFVMVLDSTVMNVSISTIVVDLHTTVSALQAAITFYALTMAALMLLGGKLGDIWGRQRAFRIGAAVYALGSLITGLSVNVTMLMIGWSLIEGLGAVLVIPAIAALAASHYQGKDRVTAYAIIGAVSGAAAAAGPLIGGYITTYLSWRYVFFGEVVIMAVLLLFFSGRLTDTANRSKERIDFLSVLLSAGGLILIVFGMLQSKTWGWLIPKGIPVILGKPIDPAGISLVAYLIVLGLILLRLFYTRQQRLEKQKKNPLLRTSIFAIPQLRSGLLVLLAQYLATAAVFFVIPVYLQITLGFDALQTGLHILGLSVAIILFSVVGTRLSGSWSPKKIVRLGQWLLIVGSAGLLGSVSPSLRGVYFQVGIFLVGGGLGLLASQLGNINMSSVGEDSQSEVGGVQGVAQNLGSSFGTALIGSVMIIALTSGLVSGVQASNLPSQVKNYVQENTKAGVPIVTSAQVTQYAEQKGLPQNEVQEVTSIYSQSQIKALRVSLFTLVIILLFTLLFSRNIPDVTPRR